MQPASPSPASSAMAVELVLPSPDDQARAFDSFGLAKQDFSGEGTRWDAVGRNLTPPISDFRFGEFRVADGLVGCSRSSSIG
jgi:hypothetical protein